MCDYSLHALQTRLAVTGEQLVVHRFRTGSIGLASPPPVITDGSKLGFWRKFFHAAFTPDAPECAVCIPPGARLLMHDISRLLQRDLQVHESEEVTFAELTARENTYRDAVRFESGEAVLLQHLIPGQRVEVLSLAASEDQIPAPLFEEVRV